MCTTICARPRDLGLSADALATLADLYAHPIVRALAEAFRAAGGQLFVVGGPVRDALRGHADFSDLDFTTNLRPPQTQSALRQFGKTWDGGASFGTVCVNVRHGEDTEKVEITTFRTEVYTPESRKPTVSFGDSILDDLKRRDLTINAIALNVVDGCLIDPFDGIGDLERNVLETPDDPVKTLSEDPLRILRVIRFAARLGATPTPRLRAAIAQTRHRLAVVSAERRRDELDKLFTAGIYGGLLLASDLDVLSWYVPGHGEIDLVHTLVADSVDEVIAALHLNNEDPTPHLQTMKLSGERSRSILTLHSLAREIDAAENTDAAARRLLRKASDDQLRSAENVLYMGRAQSPDILIRLDQVGHHELEVRARLPVSGKDLLAVGLKGRAVGKVLADLEQRLCREGHLDRGDALGYATAYAAQEAEHAAS